VPSPSGGSPSRAREDVNPPPPEAALAVFLIREAVALLFVAGWLVLFAGELLTGRYTLPLWVHAVGVAVLAYALGLNTAALVYRPAAPTAAAVGRAVVERHRAEEDDT
jgi:hypothetical protein